MRAYWVTTPEYDTVEDRIDGYTLYGRGCDFEQVDATNAREAVRVAVRGWLDEWVVCPTCHGIGQDANACFYCSRCSGKGSLRDHWKRDNYCLGRKQDGLCPWTGIRAEIALCPHGVEMPVGFENDFWCDRCRAEWDSEVDA